MRKKLGYPHASATFEWLFVLFAAMQVSGVLIDGWAHAHLDHIETFFTPWHAVFYGGFFLSAAILVIELLKNHARGYPWLRALPREYRFALAGAVIFMIGGVGDLTWHTFFGIESGVDALLSPTHMLLAIGGAIMSSGPLHAIWYRSTNVRKILKAPVVLSFLLFFTTFTFMMQFFHPHFLPLWMSNLPGSGAMSDLERTLHQELGVADAIVYTGIFMGLLLSTIRRWKFPWGSFEFILGMNALGITLMRGDAYESIIAGCIAGFFVDIIYQTLFHRLQEPHMVRLFGFLIPIVIFAAYALVTLMVYGTWWSVHLVAGYIVIAGMTGALMTYLVVPPGDQAVNQ